MIASNLLTSPAAQRNRGPILDALRRVLPASGLVLEVASGSGEHAELFAAELPALTWQPSDPGEAERISVEARRELSGLPNLLVPVALDAASPDWPITAADAIVCINMIHIAPWRAAEGLFAGASRVLRSGGVLFLYGPFREAEAVMAPSNAAFDSDLRARNPDWGIRDLERVRALAAGCGFEFAGRAEMPANNLSVVFRRT